MQQESLWQGGPSFFYDDGLFKPSTDSFLLAYFDRPRPGSRICDLGCGSGFLGLLLLAREPRLHISNLEIQEDALALCRRNFAQNGWEDKAEFHLADLRQKAQLPPHASFDHVISNPPYFKPGRGAASKGEARQTARESGCTVEELCFAAGHLLRYGGTFSLVFRSERMSELFAALQKNGMEPKRLRLVQHRPDSVPSLFLLEAKKGGKSGLQVEPVLLLQQADGNPGPEYNRIYFRED